MIAKRQALSMLASHAECSMLAASQAQRASQTRANTRSTAGATPMVLICHPNRLVGAVCLFLLRSSWRGTYGGWVCARDEPRVVVLAVAFKRGCFRHCRRLCGLAGAIARSALDQQSADCRACPFVYQCLWQSIVGLQSGKGQPAAA